MNILVTGVSGMLGSLLAVELSKSYNVYGTGRTEMNIPINYKVFDLSKDSYDELIHWSQPDLIIHCAALTNGNYCDNNPLEAININGVSIKKLIDSTSDKVKIIYVSTDAVFPSDLHMAEEKDNVNPESVYGKSKELGEYFLLSSKRKFLILRTTIVGLNLYRDKSGFVEWIVNSAKKNEKISLFKDVLFTPISIWDFTREIKFLIEKNDYKDEIYHLAGSEAISKYDFGMALLEELSLSTEIVEEGYISNFDKRAKRSSDQSLKCSFYIKTNGRKLPKLQDTIKSIKKNLTK